jgi:hypothetical protein
MEPHKTTLLYFIINSLEILGQFSLEMKELAIEYVLNNAVRNKEGSIHYYKSGRYYRLSRRKFHRLLL